MWQKIQEWIVKQDHTSAAKDVTPLAENLLSAKRSKDEKLQMIQSLCPLLLALNKLLEEFWDALKSFQQQNTGSHF